jgi:hypothetical protein
MLTKNSGGLWVICDDFGQRVDDALLGEGRAVSMYLNTSSLGAGSSCLALVSRTPSTIDYISVATAGRRAGDLERKVAFGPALHLLKPLVISEMLEKIQGQFRRYVEPPIRRVTSIPPASWNALLNLVVGEGGIEEADVDRLYSVIESRKRAKNLFLSEIIDFERDATAVAIEAFRGSLIRQRYLNASPASDDAPFIKALEKSGASVLEDRMIDHDLNVFPGAEAITRHMVGAVKIETDTGTLTIVNANRTGIEKTLGVDLVYYHHSFGAFTMVQYKRLTGQGQVYRPSSDASYESELGRMRDFASLADNTELEDIFAYRLDSNPFYFKFCASRQWNHWSRMLPGMYLPLRLWERFISSNEALGPRGGIAIGYDNAHRRMNNSEFIKLVRGGWIGSHGANSSVINKIIERELGANKSVVAAIHHENKSPGEYLRDTHGRFASEDDPDAL